MPVLVIPELDEDVIAALELRAKEQGTSASAEAEKILSQAMRPGAVPGWDAINALRRQLEAAGGSYSDSVELLREDRER